MSGTQSFDIEQLDLEWIDLILMARNMGLSIEQVRDFLRTSGETRSEQEVSHR